MKSFYMERIAEAQSIDELNYIVENAAYELRNNDDYQDVYDAALQQIAIWRRIAHESAYDARI